MSSFPQRSLVGLRWWRPTKLVLLSLSLLLGSGSVGAETAAPASPAGDWWRTATFYHIFVRSFQDSSTGPLAGDGIGDFRGVIERLDYLNDGDPATTTDLGVDAIWLMPIQDSGSYHGYDVRDYFATEPDYGTLDDFRELLREAHRRGLRVIMDLVLNHASYEHAWFKEAAADETGENPKRQYFRFSPERLQNVGPFGEPCWHYNEGEFYYGVFAGSMPDWNFDFPGTTEHHREVARFWLQEVGVDGFRLDAIRFFHERGGLLQDTPDTLRWLADYRAYCHSLKADAFVVGEAWADTDQVAAYVRAGSVDTAFEFNLAEAMMESSRFGLLLPLRTRLERVTAAYRGLPFASFLSNHDKPRVMTQLGGDRARAGLAAAMLFTMPGVPFIYYGEEIGLEGDKPDPQIRTPMPWTAEAPGAGFSTAPERAFPALRPDFTTVNVAAQKGDPQSLLSQYRGLIRLRQAVPALRSPDFLPVTVSRRGPFGSLRLANGQYALVLANLQGTPLTTYTVELPPEARAGAAQTMERRFGTAITPFVEGTPWTPLATLAPTTLYVLTWPAHP